MISELYWPDVLGGVEYYLRDVSEALAEKNDVFIICSSSNNKVSKELVNNVKVYRIPTDNFYPTLHHSRQPILLKPFWHLRSLKSKESYKRIKQILELEKPDIVHTHNLLSISTYIFKAIRELNLPHIHELHDCSLLCPIIRLNYFWGGICKNPSPFCKIYRCIKKRIVGNLPNLVIAPSQTLINMIQKEGFFNATKTKRIFLGIKLPKKNTNKSYETIDILYVGELSKHKGPHILIKAFHIINNQNFRLHICGEGKDRKKLENLARYDKRIKFYGYVDDLENFYSQANVVVVPSLCFDNSPRVIIEAFAYDTPVIGSRVGGIPELIKDGKNGLLFNQGDVNELTQKLLELNPSRLEDFVRNVRNEKEKYSIRSHLDKLMSLYKVF